MGCCDKSVLLMGTESESPFQEDKKTVSVWFFDLTTGLNTSEAALRQNSPAFVLNFFLLNSLFPT